MRSGTFLRIFLPTFSMYLIIHVRHHRNSDAAHCDICSRSIVFVFVLILERLMNICKILDESNKRQYPTNTCVFTAHYQYHSGYLSAVLTAKPQTFRTYVRSDRNKFYLDKTIRAHEDHQVTLVSVFDWVSNARITELGIFRTYLP